MRLALAVVALAAVPTTAAAAAGTIVPLTARIEPVSGVVREQFARVEVAETDAQTTYAVPADVLFAFDSARVTGEGRRALRRLGRRHAGARITVVGHTDRRGGTAYNLRLSRRRAEAAARVLRAAGASTTVRAHGETQPRSRTDAARNRRVEIVVPRRR